ncbi:hypothetical protein A2304_04635 [Candidatus Uhrbacteria bacterium RIFOXYB2_FULL_57_15]|uniref:Uncharacterized protein n=1 Tax=Candidatus Uhrbacteria bacterium RIFOXYB2_FULL_57_15 TaxID=1802422 RepID=A0A1F7W8Z8_9BACT|nr:MAG: hypothetical protein A2304_04635 [Candidatus Uhrbacteria bacterium RIFOXYB2_FULL_57_15]OGL99934.1 MAG: hypothetical protein A2501_04915 [Candidatus Uhrbacteria bacterium RIFOXYC12_FULL_57_11]
MSDIYRILLGIAVMLIGLWMVIKTELLLEWFGEVDWAEEKMGYGQSRLFYKLLGTGVSFLGILILTNIISDVLAAFAGIFVRP